MRIAVDMTVLQSASTGIGIYITRILSQLESIDSVNEYFLLECRPVAYVPKNPRWRKVSVLGFLPVTVWMQLVLPFLLRTLKIDVFWASRQFGPVCVPRRICMITTVYDFVYLRYPRTMKLISFLLHKALVRKSLVRSVTIAPISHAVAMETVRYIPEISTEKIRSVPCGAPPWKIPPTYHPSQRDNSLLFVGSFEPRKNLLALIKALEILLKQGAAYPLHLIGPKGWKSGLEQRYLRNSPVLPHIVFRGYLPEEDLRRAYLNCHALVFPSLYEGFGIPVLEALACDCLVLTSKGTVMEEVAGDAVLYFNPTDPENIAHVIQTTYKPGFDRNNYLKHSGDVSGNYSWERSARILLDIFNKTGET